jgi:hypothetical protein
LAHRINHRLHRLHRFSGSTLRATSLLRDRGDARRGAHAKKGSGVFSNSAIFPVAAGGRFAAERRHATTTTNAFRGLHAPRPESRSATSMFVFDGG